MRKIENQTIEGQSLSIDDVAFINCTILNCVLEYSGRPFLLEDTQLKGCRYVFYGAARGTVHFLQSVGMFAQNAADWGEFSGMVN